MWLLWARLVWCGYPMENQTRLLLCEPEESKPDQVIMDDLAYLYRSIGLVAHTHMHMYVLRVSQVNERAEDKVRHT